MSHIAFDETDNILWWEDAYTIDLATGVKTYLDETATVEITVYDSLGVPLTGEVWPLAFTYIPGSPPGRFIGILRDALVYAPGDTPRGVLVIDNGVDQRTEITVNILVQARRV